MRRTSIALALAFASAPAGVGARPAPPVQVTHRAPLPCAEACSIEIRRTTLGRGPCADSAPAGSFDQTVLTLTGDGTVDLETGGNIDYDTYVCTDTEPSVLVEDLFEECYGHAPWSDHGIGCSEAGSFTRSQLLEANGGANDRFRIRSFNYADIDAISIRVWGPVSMVDDSYEARPI